MERPYCGSKTKLDTSISYVVTGLVIVVHTLRENLLCNGLSENSPVFGVTGKSRLLFSSRSLRSNRTPRALFRENLSVLESK